MSPITAGYCEDKDHNHQCRSCAHFDSGYQEDGSEPKPECELLGEPQPFSAEYFRVATAVDRNGGCAAWAEPRPDDDNPSGQEGYKA